MHKLKTRFLTAALITALVLGSVPADVVQAQAMEPVVEEATVTEETTSVEVEAIETETADTPAVLAAGETLELNETNIPDPEFRQYLRQKFDTDGNGWINPLEVKEINLYDEWDYIHGGGIDSLQGIEYFTELTVLRCSGTYHMGTLDVSKNTKLRILICSDSYLTSLDVSHNPELVQLWCHVNKLTSLDLSHNPKLEQLDCSYNKLTDLDVSQNPELRIIYCQDNDLTGLDVSHNTKLDFLGFDYEKFGQVDVSNSPELYGFDAYFYELPKEGTLDLTKVKGCKVMDDLSAVSYSLNDDGYCVIETGKGHIVIHAEFVSDLLVTGIYHASQNRDGILVGLCTEGIDKSQVEFSWYICKDGVNWTQIQDWTLGNEWLSYKPDEYGDYVLVGKARYTSQGITHLAQASSYFSYHPEIKGMCQMPYTGEGGGYLIGVESYDNPGQAYQYEMLILDCTLLAEGKDAWVYTTGKCGVADGSAFWTIWQPQYGYYWTLFRVYDSKGNLIDETCYGFENI